MTALEKCESSYVIVCISDLTEEMVNASIEGYEGIILIRQGTKAVLEFKVPYPNCCAGLRKYSRDEIDLIINDESIFVPCGADESAKSSIMCADDRHMGLTWAEIDGVRRIVQIRYSSPALNLALGQTVEVVRDFTYQIVDPFDLIEIEDTVLVT